MTKPVFILVRPQLAENVGMTARAMMNCGIDELRLVAPRENHLSEIAVRASSGAERILKNAKVYNTLDEATADLNFVLATTARFRDMVKPVYTPEKASLLLKSNQNIKTGVLFGCERTGLENDEVVGADAILSIPLNPEHTSLNLSQAVLLVGYAYLNALNPQVCQIRENIPAPKIELHLFLNFLDNLLEKHGYYKIRDKKPKMQRNLEDVFNRAGLTSQEIRTLYGIFNTFSKKNLQKEIESDINEES